jgi:hypothetical protein
MKRTVSALLALLLISLTSFAQQPAPAQGKAVEIPDGTELAVVTADTISSKTATEGDPLTFKMDEDLKINGVVVIAKGTFVKGYVSSAEKNGHFGKAGKLGIRVESTKTVDNQTIKLRASKGKEGDSKTGTTVALVVLFGPLGFLKHGKNAEIKEGTKLKVFTDEAKTVNVPQA